MYGMLKFGALLLVLAAQALADISSPKVNVYTELPIEDGKQNTVICHTSEFHPPNIEVDLLRNGEEMSDVQAKDMSFDGTWKYQLLKYHKIIYKDGDKYSCRVRHMDSQPKVYLWEPML